MYDKMITRFFALPKGEYQLVFDTELGVILYQRQPVASDDHPCPAEYSESCSHVVDWLWNDIATGDDDVFAELKKLGV
jgi:hypothetical protein